MTRPSAGSRAEPPEPSLFNDSRPESSIPFPVMPRPYQPSLLRLLHGATALLVPLAWITGLLVYSTHDGRFGRLPFTLPREWIDIHGTVGVLLWPIALLFGLYALTAGRPRLRQPANAIALLALVLAVGSGKLMDEDWLRDGQFDHLVYGVHLLAWLLIALAIALHVGSVLQRGGLPLARSMASLQVRSGDLPGNWLDQIRRSLKIGR
ncbi:MAG: cytochrome b/b6 domain-containing protein [Cyanobacteriota bacterium]